MTETPKCPHCGASMKKHAHRLTPMLVKALAKFARAVSYHGRNDIHLSEDMDGRHFELTTTEHKNWTKLRYHGMVAHADKENTRNGRWLLTRRGGSFLLGEIEVPQTVWTFRQQIIERDPTMVNVSDVLKSDPYLETIEDVQSGLISMREARDNYSQ